MTALLTQPVSIITKKKREVNKNRNKSRDYINGPALHQHIVDWYASGKEEIPVPIVKGILQIIDRLGTKHNFKGYSFLEEMKGDAIESCLMALNEKKYKAGEFNNPFAYFTQCAWNAFISVIKDEQKESYIKHKSLENHMQDMRLSGEELIEVSPTDNLNNDLIEKFETKNIVTKKKGKASLMDEFLERTD